MSGGPMLDDLAYAAAIRQPSIVAAPDEKDINNVNVIGAPPGYTSSEDGESHLPEPTTEELQTLRRISGKIPWQGEFEKSLEIARKDLLCDIPFPGDENSTNL
jgi:hypothetical protein